MSCIISFSIAPRIFTLCLKLGFFFFFLPCHMACGILVPQQGIEPLYWKHTVLTTGLSEKSPEIRIILLPILCVPTHLTPRDSYCSKNWKRTGNFWGIERNIIMAGGQRMGCKRWMWRWRQWLNPIVFVGKVKDFGCYPRSPGESIV